MDIDDDGTHLSTPSNANALAGPSTLPVQPPTVFLSSPPPFTPQSHLQSTQDLLARFQLLSAYDKHVRPFVTPIENGQDHFPPPLPGASDRGKGKEREKDPPPDTSPAAQTPGADAGDADDDDGTGHGEKKKRNNYKHLIKGVPGKHSMKKDDYLTTIMQVPQKQRIPITPFDLKTQREAFSVSLEGLKGWNPSALILESAQAREDRKRRKELKKMAKAQALLPSTSAPLPPSTIPPANAIPAHIPTPNASHPPPTRTATPKPGIPRPGSRPTLPTTMAAGTTWAPTGGATPSTMNNALSEKEKEKRGKKRDHHEVARTENVVVVGAVDVEMNGEVGINGAGLKAVIGAKAGRPIKKQRMDIQGQARDVAVPVQQPTPQGV